MPDPASKETMDVSGAATLAQICAIADGAAVAVPPAVLDTLRQAADRADDLSRRHPVYGRTTGVGANKSTGTADDECHGIRLLRSHAVDIGPPVATREVRAMLAVRLNQLCRPGSGIDPLVLTGLVEMLNADALPAVRRFGSVGTGDLAALAGTALTLVGERPASRPLRPMAPWGADSALAFLSSSALTVGQACLLGHELEQLLAATEIVYAFSFTALRGNPSAWSPEAAEAIGVPVAGEVAARLRTLLLPLTTPAGRIQDPFALRVFCQTHSEVVDALERLTTRLHAIVGRAQENPLFSGDQVVHHGAFYQAGLGLGLDALNLAVAQASTTTLARIRMAHEPAQSGRRAFLAAGPAGSSGTMMLEYVAASAIAELGNAAQPVSTGSLSLSRDVEEDAPFAAQAVQQLRRGLRALRILLSCELIVGIRLLRMAGLTDGLGPDLSHAYALVAGLSADVEDRDLRGDLELAAELVSVLGSACRADAS